MRKALVVVVILILNGVLAHWLLTRDEAEAQQAPVASSYWPLFGAILLADKAELQERLAQVKAKRDSYKRQRNNVAGELRELRRQYAGRLVWPTASPGRLIGFPYQGTHRRGNWESDRAVDIGVKWGTPIYAVSNGKVGGCKKGRYNYSAGWQFTLRSRYGAFFYAHMSRMANVCGKWVKKGQYLGRSGSANGVSHLHFARSSGKLPRKVPR